MVGETLVSDLMGSSTSKDSPAPTSDPQGAEPRSRERCHSAMRQPAPATRTTGLPAGQPLLGVPVVRADDLSRRRHYPGRVLPLVVPPPLLRETSSPAPPHRPRTGAGEVRLILHSPRHGRRGAEYQSMAPLRYRWHVQVPLTFTFPGVNWLFLAGVAGHYVFWD